MYLLALSDASLYISFLRGSRNFSRGSEGYFLFAEVGGPSRGLFSVTLVCKLNKFEFSRDLRGGGSYTPSLTINIREWVFEFCLEKSCMLKNYISLILSSQATVRSLHSSLLQRGSYILAVVCDDAFTCEFAFFVEKVEQSGFVLK